MPEVVSFLSQWVLAPVPTLAVALAAAAYVRAVRRVDRRYPGTRWPRSRVWFFLTGLGLLLFVVIGPVGAYDDDFFWAHMVQHLTIMMVAAPLLLMGAPVLLALRVGTRQRRRPLVALLRSRPVRVLTNPLLTWALFAATMLGTHFTPFYNFAVTHPLVHDYVEHPLYLTVALLYFYPLVGGNPLPHGPSPLAKVVSLIAQMGPESMTGFFLYTAPGVLYPAYAQSDRPFGPGPLADQQLGGALMWCGGMVVGAVWISVAVAAWLSAESRAAHRIDRQVATDLARAVTR
ncbi:MAG: cytochrome c oxidase assembly protein [Actinomycetota bacterium]|nr:cytochrome c oxidase assembly protein [Actinomycetota bacterium]